MKIRERWKKIVAGIMVCFLLITTVDSGCITAMGADIQREKQQKEHVTGAMGYNNVDYFDVSVSLNLGVNSDFYGKQTLFWEPVVDADGYVISVYKGGIFGTNAPIHTEVINDNTISSYVFDTLEFDPGTQISYSIYAFVNDGEVLHKSKVEYNSGVVRGKPLEFEADWYVKSVEEKEYLVLNITEETQEIGQELDIWFFEEGESDSFYLFSFEKTGTTTECIIDAVPDKEYYIYLAIDHDTALQDEPVLVGGEYKQLQLEVVEDVTLASAGEIATLEAVVTNPMENFDYRYQWFVLDEIDAEAVAIEEATESAYQVMVETGQTKYFFCRVTAEYGEKIEVDTVNSDDKPTMVTGSLIDLDVAISEIESVEYTGQAHEPEVEVLVEGVLLEKDVDYTISYKDNVDAGIATVVITFCGDYSGTRTTTFEILAKELSVDNITVTEEMYYAGIEVLPDLYITDGEYELIKGKDYTIGFAEGVDNINLGVVDFSVTFINNYFGTVDLSFEIVMCNIDALTFEPIVKPIYSGQAQEPELCIYNGEVLLEAGVDYDVVYSNNIESGRGLAYVTLKGNYIGEKTIYFIISPKPADENFTIFYDETIEYVYNEEKHEPEVVVKDGETVLQEGLDYTVAYLDNINASENANISITFINNYSGSISRTFTILPVEIPEIEIADISEQVYTGQEIVPSLTVTSGDITFVAGVDYDIEFEADEDIVNVGEVTLNVVLKGNYQGSAIAGFEIVPLNAEECADINVSDIPDEEYTGKALKPGVNITHNGIKLKKGTDYTISYKNNKKIGTAKVIITFIGNYMGVRTKSFDIFNPIPTAITSEKVTVSSKDKTVSKVTIGTIVKNFIKALEEKKYVSVFDAKNKKVSDSSVLATGMKACIMDGDDKKKSYTIIVTGDTNGDGKINITDVIAIKASTLKKANLKGVYQKAGDVNGDGKINITDFIKVKAAILKKAKIIGVTAK